MGLGRRPGSSGCSRPRLRSLVVWVRFETAQPTIRSSTCAMMRDRAVCDHQPHRLSDRLRDVRLVHPDPAARADAGRRPATASAPASPRRASSCCPSAVMMLFAGPLAGWLGERVGSKAPAADRDGGRERVLRLPRRRARRALVDLPRQRRSSALGIGLSFAAMANLIVEAVDQTPDRRRDRDQHDHAHDRRLARRRRSRPASSRPTSPPPDCREESGFTTAFTISAVAVALAFAAAMAIPRRSRHSSSTPPSVPARAEHARSAAERGEA